MIINKQKQIVAPQMLGGDHFHIGRALDGGFVFSINNQSIRMSPAQAQDLAIKLLASLGMVIEEMPPMPGPRLVG